jgi:hypothetical protein
MLADVLQDYHGEKRTGVLFVAVKEKSENLIRIFFHDGQIQHVSYGQCSGKDCLEIMDCYEFTTAYFVPDMKAPAVSPDLPPTPQIIEQSRRAGRTVMMK